MQCYLRGFLVTCKRGCENFPPRSTAVATRDIKRLSTKSSFDTGNCFQMNNTCVRGSIMHLSNGLRTEGSCNRSHVQETSVNNLHTCVQDAGGAALDTSIKPLDIMSRRMIWLADELVAILIQLCCTPRDDKTTESETNKLIDSAEQKEIDKSPSTEKPKPRKVQKRKLTKCPFNIDEARDDPPLPGNGL